MTTTTAGKIRGGGTGFWALIATQFQGAFSDNAFKLLIILALPTFAMELGDQSAERVAKYGTYFAMLLFTLPWVLFPGYAGYMGDRFTKSRVASWTKIWELCVVAVGLVAFINQNIFMLFAMLFMMAMQSTFFSPAKYGIVPEMMPETRLSWANGVLNMTTFVAMILGTAIAGPLLGFTTGELNLSRLPGIDLGEAERIHTFIDGRIWLVGVPMVLFSLMGLAAAGFITKTPVANPDRQFSWNPWAGLRGQLRLFWRDKLLLLALVGIAYFWAAGALIQGNIVNLGDAMNWSNTSIGFLLVAIAIGIGIGSWVAGVMSGRKIELGLVPLGAMGMAVSATVLGVVEFGLMGTATWLFFLGLFGGIFDVPLMALLQHRSPRHAKGSMIAGSNFVTFAAMAGASGLGLVFNKFEITTYGIFLITGIASLGVGLYLCFIFPQQILRLPLWVLANTVYRLRVVGRSKIPARGGALLVVNHVSFIDAMVLTAALDRPVRFIMAANIYQVWWIRPIVKMLRAIPVKAGDGQREVVRSLNTATQAIQKGELVCIFAEGQITRTGQLLPFKRGLERIMKDTEAPIIPIQLDQLWGSVFSFAEGRFFWKWPRRIPFPIHVSIGEPMPFDTPAADVREAVQQLSSDAHMQRELESPLLGRAFVRTVRRHPFKMCVGDQMRPKLSYFMTYVSCIALARKLKPIIGDEKMVGLLLPQSVGGAILNIALQLMGRVPVNLNYTASKDAMASSVEQCEIAHVVTSHQFLKKFPIEVPGNPLYAEDLREAVVRKDRIIAILLAVFCPVPLLERILGAPKDLNENSLATVIFSSGSEGNPKGVMLTHRNIIANVEAVAEVFPHNAGDGMMGILPFFHSFGFTGTLWLPMYRGMFAAYHPNPLEAKIIGRLVKKYKPRFLVATPTFLQGFIRRCVTEEFESLDYVITGAEKLPERVRNAFNAKFGKEPLEGYGTTECAPVVSVNVPDFDAPGFHQLGTKHGTIGRPLPGVSVRTVNPDTGEPTPEGEAGLLLAKGPNIMKGYLKQSDKTNEVLVDGWYNTGDIGKLDEDGFIVITDRLARFSKIAGEMVPHTKVEETLHELLELDEQTFAVTSVADDKKGERLVVLHTLMDGELEVVVDKLNDSELPNLWRPKATSFYRISEIPVLGTGKMDLKAVKHLAQKFDVGE
jgi:acyl-[acyl-carrier-protein]-phospholipid O-acyltransferase/long-chain-fatty-acid--[acyl-carrier-protein] ligase